MAEMNGMIERVASAMESAELGFNIQLVRLVDGVSTYELMYSDGVGPIEFHETDEAYEHVAGRRAQVRARAAIKEMRIPDVSMIDAGAGEVAAGNGLVKVWRAMVDEALR